MINRRAFVGGTALVAVAPLIAPALESPVASLAARPPIASPTVLLIDGWSIPGDAVTTDQLWIGVNRSWRVAWR
jgi:hypothetical protein